MADYVHLLGADDVRSAGSTISHAADTIRSAASTIDFAVDRLQRFGDEQVSRLEVALSEHTDERPTLRDQFAMAALPGLLAAPFGKDSLRLLKDDPHGGIARMAYGVADAMLKAREVKHA